MGVTPDLVRVLVQAGHRVWVQASAGEKIGYPDRLFSAAGAAIVSHRREVYAAGMMVKVKEPQPAQYPLLKEGQVLFCFLHLAPNPVQTAHLMERQVVAIA